MYDRKRAEYSPRKGSQRRGRGVEGGTVPNAEGIAILLVAEVSYYKRLKVNFEPWDDG